MFIWGVLGLVLTAQATEMTVEGVEPVHAVASVWMVIPFVVLLLMIATGPLFYEHFWHKNYPLISAILASIVVLYYIFNLHNTHAPIHAAAEYFQFISLLAALYIASGGVVIDIDKEATPMANTLLLLIGAVLSNFIGTTGASMLLIRPFMRLNYKRLRAYHIVFFIFIVSNVGGSLTPIGDPPLFLGFLKGVPFFWTLEHNFLPWLTAVSILLAFFYYYDVTNKKTFEFVFEEHELTGKISIRGHLNFFWLLIIIMAVFVDPNIFEWVPYILYDGQKISFVRELILVFTSILAFKTSSIENLKKNEFNFGPIKEVAFIFIGIFGTMMPALEIVGNYAASPEGADMITANTMYWGTGMLSGFLDNAPTYINFLTAAMAANGENVLQIFSVKQFSVSHVELLKAISVSSVFFGAFTYIGNGPNFMVKSIAEEIGLKMPSFFGYIIRFSLIILLPLYVFIWLVFF